MGRQVAIGKKALIPANIKQNPEKERWEMSF